MSRPTTLKLTRAHVVLRDRVLMLGVGADARSLAADIDKAVGGLVVTGSDAHKAVRGLRSAYPQMTLILQPDVHEARPATVQDPFPFAEEPDPDTPHMFEVRTSLTEYLDGQRSCGASLVMLPTGFIAAEGYSTLTAVIKAANALDRDDVILHLPVSCKWLSDQAARAKLIAAIGRSVHPVALSLAHRSDPSSQSGVADGIHAVLAQVAGNVLLWHSDLGALDALANGALGGAIGVTAAKRHITEPGQVAFSPTKGRDRSPNTLLPVHLRYGKPNDLSVRVFANGGEPLCRCRICHGRGLMRFTGSDTSVLEAYRHNVVTITALLRRILASGDRQACWSDMLSEAVAAYAATALETQVLSFAPTGGLQHWIELNPAPDTAA